MRKGESLLGLTFALPALLAVAGYSGRVDPLSLFALSAVAFLPVIPAFKAIEEQVAPAIFTGIWRVVTTLALIANLIVLYDNAVSVLGLGLPRILTGAAGSALKSLGQGVTLYAIWYNYLAYFITGSSRYFVAAVALSFSYLVGFYLQQMAQATMLLFNLFLLIVTIVVVISLAR